MHIDYVRDVVVFAFGVSCWAIYIASFGRQLCVVGCREFITQLGQGLQRAVSPSQKVLTAKVSKKLNEEVGLRKVREARALITPFAIFLLWLHSIVLMHIARDRHRWMTFEQDIIVMILHATVVLGVIRPHLLTVRNLTAWSAFVMLFLIIFISPVAMSQDVLPLVAGPLLLARLFVGYFSNSVVLTIGVNLCYLFAAILTHVKSDGDCGEVSQQNTILQEMQVCVAVILLQIQHHSQIIRETWFEVEAAISRNELGAVRSLLGVMCDAVVELDVDLRITEDDPKLAAMLLHEQRKLKGAGLSQFLFAEDDRTRFFDCCDASERNEQDVADVVHLRMRDGNSSRLEVELFHVAFSNFLDNAQHHLVGLREHSDALDVWFGGSGIDLTKQVSSLGSSLDMLLHRATVSLGMTMMSFEVGWCSDSFVDIFGASVGSCFAEWVRNKESLKCFQKYFNEVVYNCDEEGDPSAALQCVARLELNVPAPKLSGSVDLSAVCTMTVERTHSLYPSKSRSIGNQESLYWSSSSSEVSESLSEIEWHNRRFNVRFDLAEIEMKRYVLNIRHFSKEHSPKKAKKTKRSSQQVGNTCRPVENDEESTLTTLTL